MTKYPPEKEPYVTVTRGGAGYFAVMIWWAPEGLWEPWCTLPGRYATAAEAIPEAQDWAKAEEVEYRAPTES